MFFVPPYIRLYFKVFSNFIILTSIAFLISSSYNLSAAAEFNDLKNSLKKEKIIPGANTQLTIPSNEVNSQQAQTSEIKISETSKKDMGKNSNQPSKNLKKAVNKNNKSVKPPVNAKRIKDAPVNTAARISENTEPAVNFPTPLPDDREFLKIDNSETRLFFINKIKEMYNAFTNGSYYDFEQTMNDIVNYGSNYPDLCALSKLYHVEYLISQTKSATYADDAAAYFSAADDLEKDLKIKGMLEEIAAIYKQGPKDKYVICGTVTEAISGQNGLLDKINGNISLREIALNSSIEKISLGNFQNYLEEINGIETNIHSMYSMPNKYSLESQFNSMISSYKDIIHKYLLLKDYVNAEKYFNEMTKFYNSIKNQYVIKYKESYYSDEIKENIVNIMKNPGEYVKAQMEYFKFLFNSDDEKIDKEKLKIKLDELQKFCQEVPHKSNNGENIEYDFARPSYTEPDLKADTKDLYEKISKPVTINEFYITKYDNSQYSSYNEIYNPQGTLVLKCVADHAISIKEVKIESSVSKQAKTLKLKRSYSGDYNYYAEFMPNDGINDLIKKHGKDDNDFKNTICISNGCYDNFENPFEGINEIFKDKTLGKGIFSSIKSKDEIQINTNFLENIGFESITANISQNECFTRISNQPDWVIMRGHGSPSEAAYFTETKNNYVAGINYWPLKMLQNFKNINIDFLILDCCHQVQEPALSNDIHGYGFNGLEWQKFIEKNTPILGYSFITSYYICAKAIKNLVSSLNFSAMSYPYKNKDKINIINKWLEIHQKIYNDALLELERAKLERDLEWSDKTILFHIQTKERFNDLKISRYASAIYYDSEENKNYFYKLAEEEYQTTFLGINNFQKAPSESKETQIKPIRIEIL